MFSMFVHMRSFCLTFLGDYELWMEVLLNADDLVGLM